MDKMAPENVSNNFWYFKTKSTKRSSASAFLSVSKHFNLKEVLHVKQRCSFSFKSKLSEFGAGHFNITV